MKTFRWDLINKLHTNNLTMHLSTSALEALDIFTMDWQRVRENFEKLTTRGLLVTMIFSARFKTVSSSGIMLVRLKAMAISMNSFMRLRRIKWHGIQIL
jgi:hypothetical protein